jgi:hypothetical protein
VIVAVGLGLGLGLRHSRGHAKQATGGHLRPLSSVGKLTASPNPGADGPEGVPIPTGAVLAPIGLTTPGQTVDGIACSPGEQVAFHIHAHLTIFVDGSARQIPYGIGIGNPQTTPTPTGPFVTAGSCYSWLHTHAADGIIHIESPVQRTYTLGQFFDLWRQTLGPDQVGPARGQVTAFYNHQEYLGNPRTIPLTAHAQIQLDIRTPLITPESIRFPAGL